MSLLNRVPIVSVCFASPARLRALHAYNLLAHVKT